MVTLEEVHDCAKCHGKTVFIGVDKLGNTFCGYCHTPVDYSEFFREALKRMEQEKKKNGP